MRVLCWGRAPAVEEARNRRERIAETAASMAGGSEESRTRIERIAVAFEAGRDGFWLALWLKACGIETYVIDALSIAVSRDTGAPDRSSRHRAAQALLSRLAARRGAITGRWSTRIKDEDAKRLNRERATSSESEVG